MSTTFEINTANVGEFVPRGLPQMPLPAHQVSTFSAEVNKVEQQLQMQQQFDQANFIRNHGGNYGHGGFTDFSSQMINTIAPQLSRHQSTMISNANAAVYNQNMLQVPSAYPPVPALAHSNSTGTSNNFNYTGAATQQFNNQNQQFRASQNYTEFVPTQQPMQVPNNFKPGYQMPHQQPPFRKSFSKLQSVEMPMPAQHQRRQFAKNVYSSSLVEQPQMMLPLGKVQQTTSYCDMGTPMTRSTVCSSNGGSNYNSDDDGNFEFDGDAFNNFDSPSSNRQNSYQQPRVNNSAPSTKNNKNENGWKKKVKTELCRFWLQGMDCENSQKDQGCGFAHGQDELQKKKGLSRQYLTSVCKNFLEHPSKCTYGQRCIFQHPTFDVRERQNYTHMMQDNARYTAMRLFQDIEGSEVIYINTYAATAPRLAAFRQICSSAKDNGEDYVDPEDEEIEEEETEAPTFSRDLFRN